jgi:NAD(P)-dependent dehydrogenase (short-subunit alcohol dehydrogenase family)
MAHRFAQSGATVIIAARRPDVLEETTRELEGIAPGRVYGMRCDVSSAADIAGLSASLKAGSHEIDILVNNAGSTARHPFEDITDEMWLADFDLKFLAAVRLARVAIPSMKAKGWGRIVNVVSVIGKMPGPATAPTSVTRAAGIALTKVLSHELAPFGITANALCVGLIKSDQIMKRFNREGAGRSFDEFHDAVMAPQIPMHRMGEAEEFANVAAFLASDESSYLTGCAINVDGGLCRVT